LALNPEQVDAITRSLKESQETLADKEREASSSKKALSASQADLARLSASSTKAQVGIFDQFSSLETTLSRHCFTCLSVLPFVRIVLHGLGLRLRNFVPKP